MAIEKSDMGLNLFLTSLISTIICCVSAGPFKTSAANSVAPDQTAPLGAV